MQTEEAGARKPPSDASYSGRSFVFSETNHQTVGYIEAREAQFVSNTNIIVIFGYFIPIFA